MVQMVLMEAHIRKTTPDFFAELLDDTGEFYTYMARLEAAVYAKNALMISEPERGEPPVLEAAIANLMLKIRDLRLKMAEKTAKMAQCRDEEDRVS